MCFVILAGHNSLMVFPYFSCKFYIPSDFICELLCFNLCRDTIQHKYYLHMLRLLLKNLDNSALVTCSLNRLNTDTCSPDSVKCELI